MPPRTFNSCPSTLYLGEERRAVSTDQLTDREGSRVSSDARMRAFARIDSYPSEVVELSCWNVSYVSANRRWFTCNQILVAPTLMLTAHLARARNFPMRY